METKAYYDGDLDNSRRGKKHIAIYSKRQNLYIVGGGYRELAKKIAFQDIIKDKQIINKLIRRNPSRINWFDYLIIPIEEMIDKI